MCEVLRNNKDDLALITLKKFFVENGGKVKPKPGFSVAARIACHVTLDAREIQILEFLSKTSREGTNIPVIISKIEMYIQSMGDKLTDVSMIDLLKKALTLLFYNFVGIKTVFCCSCLSCNPDRLDDNIIVYHRVRGII